MSEQEYLSARINSNRKDPLSRANRGMGNVINVIKKVHDYCNAFDWENQA